MTGGYINLNFFARADAVQFACGDSLFGGGDVDFFETAFSSDWVLALLGLVLVLLVLSS